ncbi:MAG: NAD(+) synthase [Candidatus Amulumruptor caecigallinarius]|nr:NAD(+) synthase [Candidatus Amulumruptor caecigallinarius]MCM1396728.1 NAD(+) synthase [Candidatus Amulumruptor caecigallinarius]MCM1453214.1 NAD(+) synthase [bacterium]
MHDGYLRVAAVTPPVQPADVDHNVEAILALLPRLEQIGVEIALFPEMCITGYTCGDLFHTDTLLAAAAEAVDRLQEEVKRLRTLAIIVGYPKRMEGGLVNVAAIIGPDGKRIETLKTYVPNYNEFYERRWWHPAPAGYMARVVEVAGVKVGVEICEDLWAPVPPSSRLALAGAEVIFNPSASDDVIGKYAYLRDLVSGQSSRCICGYVYAGAGFGESSTDLVFDGKGIIAENGRILAEKPRWDSDSRITVADIDIAALRHDRLHNTTFGDTRARELGGNTAPSTSEIFLAPASTESRKTLLRSVNPLPFLPPDDAKGRERCEDILSIQTAGLARRLDFIKGRSLVVGISGGLDSTLALLVAVRAFDRLGLDRKGIIGVTMPGFGTTGRTHRNALTLMERLGVSIREVSIVKAVEQHFADIGHDPEVHDVTYENSQARERTQILMDIANQAGAIVLGTGDLSELALGWATYNGDHMSMYGVNAGVPKTLVSRLVRHEADITTDSRVREALLDVLSTPISPELLPATADGQIAQVTEDLVGPYELHDFFLYHMLRFGTEPRRVLRLAVIAFDGRFSREVILKWLKTFYRRFFAQQFKRSCLPDGPKVGSVCLSPRGDWRMPSDASSRLWLAQLDSLS